MNKSPISGLFQPRFVLPTSRPTRNVHLTVDLTWKELDGTKLRHINVRQENRFRSSDVEQAKEMIRKIQPRPQTHRENHSLNGDEALVNRWNTIGRTLLIQLLDRTPLELDEFDQLRSCASKSTGRRFDDVVARCQYIERFGQQCWKIGVVPVHVDFSSAATRLPQLAWQAGWRCHFAVVDGQNDAQSKEGPLSVFFLAAPLTRLAR